MKTVKLLLLAALMALGLGSSVEAFKIGAGSGRGEAPVEPEPVGETRGVPDLTPAITTPLPEDVEDEKASAEQVAAEQAAASDETLASSSETSTSQNSYTTEYETDTEANNESLTVLGFSEGFIAKTDADVKGFILEELAPILVEKDLSDPKVLLNVANIYSVGSTTSNIPGKHPLKYEFHNANTEFHKGPNFLLATTGPNDKPKLTYVDAFEENTLAKYRAGIVYKQYLNNSLLSRFIAAVIQEQGKNINENDKNNGMVAYLKKLGLASFGGESKHQNNMKNLADCVHRVFLQEQEELQASSQSDRHYYGESYIYYYSPSLFGTSGWYCNWSEFRVWAVATQGAFEAFERAIASLDAAAETKLLELKNKQGQK